MVNKYSNVKQSGFRLTLCRIFVGYYSLPGYPEWLIPSERCQILELQVLFPYYFPHFRLVLRMVVRTLRSFWGGRGGGQ